MPPLYTYEDGTVIRGQLGYDELSAAEFRRLAQWLIPERNDTLFTDATPQRWNARRPINEP
jgi:hypothetical protein